MTPNVDLLGLDRFETISLEAVTEASGLLDRVDRKYLIETAALPRLLEQLTGSTRVLTIDHARLFGYTTLYFDTPQLALYLAAARRRPSRAKVRIRRYETGRCVLEVKERRRTGRTVKTQLDRSEQDISMLDASARDFVAGRVTAISTNRTPLAVEDLEAKLQTSYRRATLVDAQTQSRITIDVALRWDSYRGERSRLNDGVLSSRFLDDVAIVETKSTGKPTPFDRALWAAGQRPIAFSKYCVGLALLTPALRANEWTRVLRRLGR